MLAALVLVSVFSMLSVSHAADKAALWRALATKNHFALLRHAIAPGMGDPGEFVLGDCSKQRNLSEEGRKQARLIGIRFRESGVQTARIYSSQWCRCLETARLLELGPVTDMPVINSFFQRPERGDRQTQMLKSWVDRQDLDSPLILVTHQVNITALTGVFPASGELIVMRRSEDGKLSVVGSIGAE
jgi:phosphohistidine phosphatase SixA